LIGGKRCNGATNSLHAIHASLFFSGEMSLENTSYFSQFFSLLLQSWKPPWRFFLNPKKND
jgi:hypothetical protein